MPFCTCVYEHYTNFVVDVSQKLMHGILFYELDFSHKTMLIRFCTLMSNKWGYYIAVFAW